MAAVLEKDKRAMFHGEGLRLYSEAARAVEQLNAASQFKALMANFVLAIGSRGSSKLSDQAISLEAELTNGQITDVPIPLEEVIAGLFEICRVADIAHGRQPGTPDAPSFWGSPMRVIGRNFGTSMMNFMWNWTNMLSGRDFRLIEETLRNGDREKLVSSGIAALGWALQNPYDPAVPPKLGIDVSLLNMEPIQQGMAIQHIVSRTLDPQVLPVAV